MALGKTALIDVSQNLIAVISGIDSLKPDSPMLGLWLYLWVV